MGKVDSGLEGNLDSVMLGVWCIADDVCDVSELRLLPTVD